VPTGIDHASCLAGVVMWLQVDSAVEIAVAVIAIVLAYLAWRRSR
jgi:hypothetical protein